MYYVSLIKNQVSFIFNIAVSETFACEKPLDMSIQNILEITYVYNIVPQIPDMKSKRFKPKIF